MLLKYLLYWMPMILIAVANGVFRQGLLIKRMPGLRAHQVSTLMLILLCGWYTWFVFPRLDVQSPSQALLIGLIWVLLTIGFEFALGRFSKKSWSQLLADYNLAAGRIWPLFLVCLLFLPWFMYVLYHS